jgi:hypothetical protein
MKKAAITLCFFVLFFGCSPSGDDQTPQSSSSDFLIRNAWVYDRAEIVEITSHGSLSYVEAEQILLDFPLNPSNNTAAIHSFDSDGTGIITTPNNSNIGTINFGWIILPDNTLRIFLSSSLENLGVYEFTVNNELLTLTDDQEYLYNGTLIKYRARAFFNKQ